MPRRNKIYRLIHAALLCVCIDCAIAAQPRQNQFAEANEQFETWQMSLLARRQSMPGATLNAFTTDGCSGGLSAGWQYIAETIPAFAHKLGDAPPWEACCVEHDRAYWQGETEQGFAKRLAADKQLQQCVIAFGHAHAQEYADKHHISIDAVATNFTIAAELMYRAVRVGGKPCSFLPWRWGYGWPHCVPDITMTDD